jgi:TonB-linked SusC/RagA family outer membrane protein
MRKYQRLVVALLTAAIPTGLLAQERGTIVGRVTDQTTQQPLVGAEVMVVGTNARGATDQQGNYRIPGVAPGAAQVSATRIGYNTQTRPVTVVAGQTATANFTLTTSALELGGLIVTATGREQRQREIGSSVGTVNVAEVELAPVTNMAQLLQGRVAGTTVLQSSGTTGTASRIRIRGNNSISLSNAPLLIVDGVRAESGEGSLGFGVGGQTVSRLDDINPEDIESIEILKGPAASALYGTAAANGVIQVVTKRGRAGKPEFRVWSELGRMKQTTDFRDNVYATGTLVGGAGVAPANISGPCTNVRLAIGANPGRGEIGCTAVTETFRFNPLLNAETTPFRTGNRQTIGGSVSGGGDAATFYLSGENETESGVQSHMELVKRKIQANLTGNVGQSLNVGAKVGFIDSALELPQGDNALFGLVPMGLSADPRPANVEANKGYASSPQFAEDWLTFQDVGRLTASLNGEFRPLSWLAFNGLAGMDRLDRDEVNRIPRNNAYSIFGGVYQFGFIQRYTYDIANYNTTASGTATFNPTEDLVSTTTLGTQYIRELFRRIYTFGANLTPGVETSLAGATANYSAGELNQQNATLGGFAQQQFAWRDRLFLNAAVRGDKNTAFGADIGWIWYPAVSGSWVVSEEPFFPSVNFLTNLRLRAALGQSGLRPGVTDALQSFSSVTSVFQGAATPGIIINQVGNPDLKPERTTEWEAGFEIGFLDDRLGLDVTYFNKNSTNALVNRSLPPSLGAATARYENLGRVNNSGLEVLFNAQPVRTANVSWNATVSGAWFRNELVELGLDAQGQPLPDIIFNRANQRHREGYPLGSYFQRTYTFADADNNGLLTPGEVTVDTAQVFLGNPFPKREFALSSDLSLWRWFRVSGMLDYKGGHKQLNYTRAYHCEDQFCPELYDRNTSLEQQAAIIAYVSHSTFAGFVEDADFVKLREVAVTLGLPQTMARRFGANGLSVTLAGRNLATWSRYTGFDPEVNFTGGSTFVTGGSFITGDQGTLPPNRYLTVRVDANF